MTRLTPNNNIYDSSPIFWMFDTKPSNNTIRMTEIDSGYPEQYAISKTFNIYRSNVERVFTTWTAIFAEIGQSGDSLAMNLMAIVGCSSAMGYVPSPSVGSGSASNTEMNCYGYGGGSTLPACQAQDIYHPVAGFMLVTNFLGGNYCTFGDILAIDNYLECDISNGVAGEVNECVANGQLQGNFQLECDDSNAGVSSFVPIRFTCSPTTNIQTAFPTTTSTPSISPTLSTSSPTLFTLPPSKSPTLSPSNTPSLTPTKAPTITTMPPTFIPTFSPSQSPTNEPSITPTQLPTQLTSFPTGSPTFIPINVSTVTTSNQSTSSTANPTAIPTIETFISTSLNETPVVINQNINSSAQLNQPTNFFITISIIIGFIAILMGLIGYIHATYIDKNDLFQISYIILPFFYLYVKLYFIKKYRNVFRKYILYTCVFVYI